MTNRVGEVRTELGDDLYYEGALYTVRKMVVTGDDDNGDGTSLRV